MRLIDADNLRGRVCKIFLCAEPSSAEERRMAIVLGLIDSEHTITPPPNAPLTLEQLREMDGEPVWIEDIMYPPYSGWWIIGWDGDRCILAAARKRGSQYIALHYGDDWLAYRRKPGSAEEASRMMDDWT